MEWCKQLIAATISSQISSGVPAEAITRECKVREGFSLLIRPVLYKISIQIMYSKINPCGVIRTLEWVCFVINAN